MSYLPGVTELKSIHLKMSDTMWNALEKRHRETGEPIPHVIRAALAEYPDVEHSTLFQVSTSTALVEGIYRCCQIGHLREHGDFGLGTFEGLDGEMVAFDGRFYQVRSDGTVRVAADSLESVCRGHAFQGGNRSMSMIVRTSRRCLPAWTSCAIRAMSFTPSASMVHFPSCTRARCVNRRRHAFSCGRGPSAGIQNARRGRHAGRFLVAGLRQDAGSPRLSPAFCSD